MTDRPSLDFTPATVHSATSGDLEFQITEIEVKPLTQLRPYKDERIHFPAATMFDVVVIDGYGAGPTHAIRPELSEDAIVDGRVTWQEASHGAFSSLAAATAACERYAREHHSRIEAIRASNRERQAKG